MHRPHGLNPHILHTLRKKRTTLRKDLPSLYLSISISYTLHPSAPIHPVCGVDQTQPIESEDQDLLQAAPPEACTFHAGPFGVGCPADSSHLAHDGNTCSQVLRLSLDQKPMISFCAVPKLEEFVHVCSPTGGLSVVQKGLPPQWFITPITGS